jgi:phospholipid/cholesterol/gamma-HCH transport system permease protein
MADNVPATIQYDISGKVLRLKVSGRLDVEAASRLWTEAVEKCQAASPKSIEVDAAGLTHCDGAGAGLLLKLRQDQRGRGGDFNVKGASPDIEKLLSIFDPGKPPEVPATVGFFRTSMEDVGKAAVTMAADAKYSVAFFGEVCAKLVWACAHPGQLRWTDTLLLAEKAGANAIGIVSLLGFLIGLILAFQSAVPMMKFGAQVFVADLVAISLFRELGPLITAIIVASRTGSAYAAELGTMTGNEEIDALTTMGIDPVKFLTIPRVVATIFVMPLLTMFNNVLGLIGAGLLMLSIGFTPVTYIQRLQGAVHAGDMIGGLVKTLVFGFLIASIGCKQGLKASRDASGVGDAATSAVVKSIIAVILTDGVFAVVYYFIGV